MILRSRQRSEAKEFDDIEWQFALENRNIPADRVGRVAREAKNVARQRHDALVFPGQQHLAILSDLVLPFLGGQQIVRINILKPYEYPSYAGAFALFDKVRDLMAECIYLNHQSQWNALNFPQPDQPIEDGFPILVARKIIVGDKKST